MAPTPSTGRISGPNQDPEKRHVWRFLVQFFRGLCPPPPPPGALVSAGQVDIQERTGGTLSRWGDFETPGGRKIDPRKHTKLRSGKWGIETRAICLAGGCFGETGKPPKSNSRAGEIT